MTMLLSSATALVITAFALVAPPEQHRSTAARNLTADDRARIAELGIRPLHAGGISLRGLSTEHKDAQISRLRGLSRAPAQLAPSDICDNLVQQSDGTALCTGKTDGPIGDVAVRMTLAARLEEKADGQYSFVVFNTKPLEAKGLFGWTELVKANGLKLTVDLQPNGSYWTETTRMGVTMSSHEDCAERLGEKLAKLDAWLAGDLARR